MSRKAIELALRKQKVPERLLTAVMSLYAESRSRAKTVARTSEDFDKSWSTPGISYTSPLLSITVMEEATKLARGDDPWELL